MNWNHSIQKYIQEHLSYFIFVSVLFIMGVVFGAMLVNALTLEQKEDMGAYLSQFFMTLDAGGMEQTTFQESFVLHLKWLLLIFVLGLSVIGLPVILILDFLKGILIGFSIGYLVGELSWKGALFAMASIAPQNLIVVPAILIASVAAISFSVYMIRNRFMQQKGNLSRQFSQYGFLSLAMLGLLFGVSLFESFVTPHLIAWLAPWLTASA